MKIAVTYDNGNVYFSILEGTEFFKVYEVEDKQGSFQ